MFGQEPYSVDRLLVVLIPYAVLFILSFLLIKSRLSRLLFTFFFGGFLFYSGIGYGFERGVADNYATYFIVFSTVFCISFVLFTKFNNVKRVDFDHINERLDTYTKSKNLVGVILFVYLSTFFIELVYPEIKLQRLISPPKPDIVGSLRSRFDSTVSKPFLIIIVEYIRILLYPFYMVLLVKFTEKIPRFFVLLFLPIYLEYCANAYVGRSAIMLTLIFLFLMLWKFRPSVRKRMVVITAAVIPLFVAFSLIYQVIRQRGGEFNDKLDVTVAAEVLLHTETSLPAYSKEIIDQNHRVDLGAHLTWMFTIAIPKFGLIKTDKGLAGYEMAEILTDSKRTEPTFWVPLTGYMTENVYVYGKNFFWIPAVFVAFVLSYLGKLLDRIPLLYGFALFLGLSFAYNLNRAGIGSALPLILNNNLLMYGLLVALLNKLKVEWRSSKAVISNQ